jgi:hypothetical protein
MRFLGFLDDAQIAARAFCRLGDDIIRMPWVTGVVTPGFARPPVNHAHPKAVPVLVLTSVPPDDAMRRTVGEVLAGVNRGFGTHLKVTLEQRLWPDSGTHPPVTPGGGSEPSIDGPAI